MIWFNVWKTCCKKKIWFDCDFKVSSHHHDTEHEKSVQRRNNTALEANSTIHAADPSLFLHSKRNLDVASLLSLNNDYERLLEDNYSELKYKCLNEINEYDYEAQLESKKFNTTRKLKQPPHLTHVDVTVPSSRRINEFYSSSNRLNSYEPHTNKLNRDFNSGNTTINFN